jgi:hypothetical protein
LLTAILESLPDSGFRISITGKCAGLQTTGSGGRIVIYASTQWIVPAVFLPAEKLHHLCEIRAEL